jgi:hypothetical protein
LVEPRAGAEGNVSQQSTGPGTVPGNRVTGAEAHTEFRENIATRRYTPEAGAVCSNWARTDLCGGRGVTRPYREPRPKADIGPDQRHRSVVCISLSPPGSQNAIIQHCP